MAIFKTAARLCARSTIHSSPVAGRRISGKASDFANSKFFRVSEEVTDAIATGKPVVALETTIYTHGFPYPDNVALASLLESVVRSNGGVPATIAVFNGVARVGLNSDEIIEIAATAQSKTALKVSRRDLGYLCGLGLSGKPIHGGTTIAGTMILAHLAGIKVFGTGGLGGVHRGGEVSMDISADLTELGRTPVAVISSGCKSFLDLPRTLEYLETEGVLVGTFADGRKGNVDFPAFWTRDSGVRSPKVIENEYDAAAIIYAQNQLGISSGIHFANPVPEEYSVPKAEMDKVIDEAVRLAEVQGFQGSDNTPFVLAKIKELSGGSSISANRALIESNVTRATKVAVELAKLEQTGGGLVDRLKPVDSTPTYTEIKTNSTLRNIKKADVLVAGSLAIDFSCDFAPIGDRSKDFSPAQHTSNPATIGQSLGGVGHNVAIAASYAGSTTVFCSVVADDLSGKAALAALENEQLSTEGVQALSPSQGVRTAQYVAVNDAKKDLFVAMADMGIMELPESSLNFDGFWEPLLARMQPNWVVLDANWSSDVLNKWALSARKVNSRVAFEPVSTAKATRLFKNKAGETPVIGPFDTIPSHKIDLAAPNGLELTSMYSAARASGLFDSPEWWKIINSLNLSSVGSRDLLVSVTSAALVDAGIPQQSIQLLPFLPCLLTKLGHQGVLLTQLLPRDDPRLTSPDTARYIISRADSDDASVGGVYMRLFPPDTVLSEQEVVSVNGAGDTLLGVVIAGLARPYEKNKSKTLEEIIPVAQQASLRTLQSMDSVSPSIKDLARLLEA
ncbi:IdgA domain protein [Talaromyces proteolyticus]|uniref:IdgA domain protein n=1 Tax=Talaromyces proteolyticus TaxID=1131652 RepID=A0AAD4Q0R3_9EURO|nr:IdgA domain protein [Talaromyces proteolyticus]KAH8704755.1 IdgA domain protein [Talaromyces proteolyticus]